jgi:hypothetical protein
MIISPGGRGPGGTNFPCHHSCTAALMRAVKLLEFWGALDDPMKCICTPGVPRSQFEDTALREIARITGHFVIFRLLA